MSNETGSVKKWTVYPKLAKVLGARKAKRLLESVRGTPSLCICSDDVMKLLVWEDTPQGFTYWCKLDRDIRKEGVVHARS